MKQTKVEKLYGDPKTKNFVNHLIQSYMPVSKITKVFVFNKEHNKKCNICSQALMSTEDALQSFHENKDAMFEQFMIDVKAQANAMTTNTPVESTYASMAKDKVGQGRVLAFTGDKTNTCLCLQCTQDLLHLVELNLLNGDKNISYQINKLQRAAVFNSFNKSPHLNSSEKEQVKKIERTVEKKKVATLGDLDVLQKLKEKMEQSK